MKKKLVLSVLTVIAVLGFATSRAQNAPGAITDELKGIVAEINAKIQAGKTDEADFAGQFKKFDALLASHKNEKTDDVARVLFMKADLYIEVLNDPVKAQETFRQLKSDFPDTKYGKDADRIISGLDKPVMLQKNRESLAVGKAFPDFTENDFSGKPLSLSQYKGKVVLVDFWATWCTPCMREFPNTLKVYKKYHDQGFEIIGVSLDDDRAELEKFLKENNVPWQQFYDGQGRDNKLAVKYGADSPPAFYLLDRAGKIIRMDRYPDTVGQMRGDDLDAAVDAALKAK